MPHTDYRPVLVHRESTHAQSADTLLLSVRSRTDRGTRRPAPQLQIEIGAVEGAPLALGHHLGGVQRLRELVSPGGKALESLG